MLALSAVFAVVISTISMPGDRAFAQMSMTNEMKIQGALDALEAAVADPDRNAAATGTPGTDGYDPGGEVTQLVAAITTLETALAVSPAVTDLMVTIDQLAADSTQLDPAVTPEVALSTALGTGDSATDGTALGTLLTRLTTVRGAETTALAAIKTALDDIAAATTTVSDGTATAVVLSEEAQGSLETALDGIYNALLASNEPLTAEGKMPADYLTMVKQAIVDAASLPDSGITATVTVDNVAITATGGATFAALYTDVAAPDPDTGTLVDLQTARGTEARSVAAAKKVLNAVKDALDDYEFTALADDATDADKTARATKETALETAQDAVAPLIATLTADGEEFTAFDELAALKTALANVGVPSSGVTMKRVGAVETALLMNNVDDFDGDDDPSNGRDVVGNPVDALIDDSLDHIIAALGANSFSDLDGEDAQKAAIAALDDVLTKVDAVVTTTAKADDTTDTTATSSTLTQSDVDRLKAALDAFDALEKALAAKHIQIDFDDDPVNANSVVDHRMALNSIADEETATTGGAVETLVATAATALTTALQADGDGTESGHQPSATFTAFDESGLLATALTENPGITDDTATDTNEGVSVTTAQLGEALMLERKQHDGTDTPDVDSDDYYSMSTDDLHATLAALVALLDVDTVPDVAGDTATTGTQSQGDLVTLANALQTTLNSKLDDGTTTTTDSANDKAEAYRSETLTYSDFAAMAALQDALDDLEDATASDINDKVKVAREALIAAHRNNGGLTSEIMTELSTAYTQLIILGSTQHAYAQRDALLVVKAALADEKATEGLAGSIETALTTQSPEQQQAAAMISRIEPAIRGATVSGGDTVRLSLEIYGLQDKEDSKLGNDVTFTWTVDPTGGTLPDEEKGNSTITYKASSSPGRYVVKASLDANECYHADSEVQEDKCSAEFVIQVRRPSAPQPERPAPVNPTGEIPELLADDGGNQYAVFTPEDGGTFSGEGYSITAEAGAVQNGEFIGVRISDDGAASNLGMTHQRYTLGGNMYGVHAVDSSAQAVSSYSLNDPATVCLPLPDALRQDISDLAVVAINSDGSLTILSEQVRISTAGTMVCGGLSNLPASVAVGSAGAPAAIPTPTPEPTPEAPDTGGTAPASSTMVLWALMLGIAVLTLGSVLVISRRRESVRK